MSSTWLRQERRKSHLSARQQRIREKATRRGTTLTRAKQKRRARKEER